MSIVSVDTLPLNLALTLLEDLHLVKGCIHIVGRALLYLYCDKGLVFKIPAEPDSRKVPPAQLLNHSVPVDQYFSDVYRVVSTNVIVLYALVL